MTRAAARAWRDAVVVAVEQAAPAHSADPALLLDSLEFIDTLDDLVTTSPTADWFGMAIDKKVQAAVERAPERYRLRPAVDPWPILKAIDEYVSVAGVVKDVQPIRDALAPIRKQLRA